MSTPFEDALAFLDRLEADRRAAIAISEQKAEEAKLIRARQEGFQAAMEMLGSLIPVADAEADPKKPGRRRIRRPIPELILRELSFSGEPMTTTQIAKAIDYNSERTGTVLARLETSGKVLRNSGGRWAGVIAAMAQPDLRAVAGRNDAPSAPQALGGRASKEALKQPAVPPSVLTQAVINQGLERPGAPLGGLGDGDETSAQLVHRHLDPGRGDTGGQRYLRLAEVAARGDRRKYKRAVAADSTARDESVAHDVRHR
jgi:hypothetical protein